MATSVCTAASVKTKPIWGHENPAKSAAIYLIQEVVCEQTNLVNEMVLLEHSAGVSCLSGHLHRMFQVQGGHPLLALEAHSASSATVVAAVAITFFTGRSLARLYQAVDLMPSPAPLLCPKCWFGAQFWLALSIRLTGFPANDKTSAHLPLASCRLLDMVKPAAPLCLKL